MCFAAEPVFVNNEAVSIATRGLRTIYTRVRGGHRRAMCYIKIDEEEHRQFIVDFVDITICATAGHMQDNVDGGGGHAVEEVDYNDENR